MKNAATALALCSFLLLVVLVLTQHFGICRYPQKPLQLIRQHQTDKSTPRSERSRAHDAVSNRTTLRSTEHDLPLVVHLVPHSHCDAAYKKTFEEYYETEVRHILNSVLDALSQDNSRRFLWSETSYLVKWWKDPRTLQKDKQFFQQLVQFQRLELVNGGWVMHDEAITRYDSQIQQMTYGHDLLSQLFFDTWHRPNISISTGWQIDPFGASSTTVNLANWSGMELLITNRLPHDIKEELKANQTLEFLWKVPGASLLVHVMDTHYESPMGFEWESLEHPSTVVTKDNVQNKSDILMSLLQERATYYITNNVFIPMGGDFRFQNASLQFDNMDRLVAYIHLHPERYGNATLRYSTVREYQQALLTSMATSNKTFPVVSGSHFLLLWGGFYTTLPVLKQMVRVAETVLRTCHVRVFQALRQQESSNSEYFQWLTSLVKRLRLAQEVVALMQHHDALPATSYKYVLGDYMIHLQSSYNDMTDVLLKLLQGPKQSQDSLSSFSPWTQGSIVGGGPYLSETLLVRDTSSAKSIHLSKILNPQMGLVGIPMVVLNSLAQEVDSLVHVVCARNDVAIVLEHDDSQTESVVSQATPLEHDLESADLGLFLISFRAKVPPLGKMRYKLHVCDLTCTTDQHPAPQIASLDCAHDAKVLSQEDILQRGLVSSSLNVQFDQQTNDLVSLTRLQQDNTSITMPLTHDVILYNGENDTVYNFVPDMGFSDPLPLLGTKKRRIISAYQGALFSEVTLELTTWLSVRYRVLNTTGGDLNSLLQMTMVSGPLPPSINVASRFQTNMATSGWWYDENGFHPVHATYNESNTVGDGNTRPLVSCSWLQDQHGACPSTFSVVSTDPRGVVSHGSGQLDIFWHRRNNKTRAWWDKKTNRDWWREGEDISTARSSVWLSLEDCQAKGARKMASIVANDVVLLQVGPNQAIRPDISLLGPIPDELHTVTLRLSGVDEELESSREEMWIDLQIENLSETDVNVVDLALLLGKIPGLFLNAVTLRSLTYLHILDDQNNEIPIRREEDPSCSLSARDGGSRWLLSIGARRICSVRIPLAPLKLGKAASSLRFMYGIIATIILVGSATFGVALVSRGKLQRHQVLSQTENVEMTETAFVDEPSPKLLRVHEIS